jgi:hypothetical protein
MNEFLWEGLLILLVWPFAYFLIGTNPVFTSLLLARFFTEK